MAGRLEGKIAIVTGAGSPIGSAIAQRFADEGAKLVIADIDRKSLAGVKAQLTAGDPIIVEGDLAREEEAGRLVKRAVDAFGRVDILVNNAGGGIIRAFLDHTPETLRTTIDRNLWTTLWCTWHAIPHMKANGYGRIVNIGADSVRNGLWLHAGYNAAKGGVHALATGVAREFAQDGITANVVAPCIVETPGVQAARQSAMAPMIEKMTSVVPMGRPAHLEEVASVVTYLASAEASFATGQVISVNGGSTML